MERVFSDIISDHDLLKHPFYLAWNEGKLSRKHLALYSCEYGTFIRMIAKGWQKIGEQKIAAEETEHFTLWEMFADSICPQVMAAALRPSIQLLWTTENNFGRYPSALGALYAFEAQQPTTAQSKLDGLRKHYGHWKINEDYFTVHAGDHSEPELLENKINELHSHEREIAEYACLNTCRALWDTLSGIMAGS